MTQFNPDQMSVEKSVLETVNKKALIQEYGAYVGMDVHKDNITIGVALPGRSTGEYRGEIANKPKTIHKFMTKLNEEFGGEVLLFCYEAGPCGYHLYHQIIATSKSRNRHVNIL